MHGRLYRYLSENWGAPFVVAFMLLLVASAVELSFGESDPANSTAVYAFYSLVIGVVLQIASYVKYGEGGERGPPETLPASPPEPSHSTPSPSSRRPRWSSWCLRRRVQWQSWNKRRKFLAVFAVVLIVAAAGTATYYESQAAGQTLLQASQSYARLTERVSFARTVTEPNGTKAILLGVSASGGNGPYRIVAQWSDGFNQTNAIGVFDRSFPPGQPLPTYAVVVVTSSDGQTARVVANFTSQS